MRRKYRKLSQGLAVLVILALGAATPLAIVGYLALHEHEQRIAILDRGQVATGRVTASSWRGRGCVFAYRFVHEGRVYDGDGGGCRLVSSHPVGSALIVRYEPRNPDYSIPVGGDTWPAWAIIPALFVLPLLLLGCAMLSAIVRDFRSKPRAARR